MAGAGGAEANRRELESTGAGGGAESCGPAGAGDLQSHARQPQESAGFAASQQALPVQHWQQPGAAFAATGVETGSGFGDGQRQDCPSAGAAPIAVETASRTQITGWIAARLSICPSYAAALRRVKHQ